MTRRWSDDCTYCPDCEICLFHADCKCPPSVTLLKQIENQQHQLVTLLEKRPDSTNDLLLRVSQDLEPLTGRLEREIEKIEAKLALAREALEYCASNDFKIEKTQNIAREALEKLKLG